VSSGRAVFVADLCYWSTTACHFWRLAYIKLTAFTDLSLCTYVSTYGCKQNAAAIDVSRGYAWLWVSPLRKISYVTKVAPRGAYCYSVKRTFQVVEVRRFWQGYFYKQIMPRAHWHCFLKLKIEKVSLNAEISRLFSSRRFINFNEHYRHELCIVYTVRFHLGILRHKQQTSSQDNTIKPVCRRLYAYPTLRTFTHASDWLYEGCPSEIIEWNTHMKIWTSAAQ
jgi:hypothetical protein